jgi:hypothetical protein
MSHLFISCPDIARSRGFELAMRGCELVAELRAYVDRLRSKR